MSSAPATSPVGGHPPERRSHERYPLNLNVDYRLIQRGRAEGWGTARTINIASGGVLIEPNAALLKGSPIELSINWPMLLEGVCPLKLVMRGRITRSDHMGVAVRARHYEFRTAGVPASNLRTIQSKVRSGGV